MGSQWRRLDGFPKVPLGFRRLRRPGSIGHVLCTDRWVLPTERAGSEGVFEAAFRRKNLHNRASPVEMHPYSRFAGLLLKGSMSLDSQVVALPYESSSFATPEGEVCSMLSFPPPTVILSRRRRISVHDVSEMYGSKYRSAGSGIPESKRVQAPLAPGFYGSCALRRTMGSAHRAGWFRGRFLKPPFGGKTVKPRLRRDGNAPLLSPAATSPPEGEILAALIFEFLMRTKDEWQEDFPLRGKWCVSTKRGAFPRAKPGCTVLRAKRASRRKVVINCGEAATAALAPAGASNLRTFAPAGRIKLRP